MNVTSRRGRGLSSLPLFFFPKRNSGTNRGGHLLPSDEVRRGKVRPERGDVRRKCDLVRKKVSKTEREGAGNTETEGREVKTESKTREWWRESEVREREKKGEKEEDKSRKKKGENGEREGKFKEKRKRKTYHEDKSSLLWSSLHPNKLSPSYTKKR